MEGRSPSPEEEARKAYLARLQLRATLKSIMTKEAFERLERVKMANPDLYAKAVQAVMYVYQSGGKKIDEETLLKILKKLRGPKKETRIKIFRK